MGNPKQKWTPGEEDALRRGVLKHGTGKWKNIQRDPEFSPYLANRSNIDLKDKWRNLTANATNGVVPRGGDKSRAQRLKELADAPAAPLVVTQAPLMLLAPPPPASSTPVSKDVKKVPDTEDSSKCKKDVSMYNAMIFEALSALNEPDGSDSTSIINYFEKKGEIPPMEAHKFRKMLTSKLRRLVGSEKLIKLPNQCYKLNTEDTTEGTKTPVPKPNNAQPTPQPKASTPQPKAQPQVKVLQARQVPIRGYLGDSIEEATLSAALTVSDAENKSFVLAEAVRESERVAMISDETEKMLHLAFEISNRSLHGEVVLV